MADDYKIPAYLFWFGVAAIAFGMSKWIESDILNIAVQAQLPLTLDAVQAAGGTVPP